MKTRVLDQLSTNSLLRKPWEGGEMEREEKISWDLIISFSVVAPATKTTKSVNI